MGPFGSNIKAENFVGKGIPVIKGANLNATYLLDFFSDFLTEEKTAELSSSIARKGDIIITHRGTLGQVGLIHDNAKYNKYLVSQSQLKLSFDLKRVNPYYVYYFLKSPIGQQQILSNKSQVGVPAIARALSSMKAIIIDLPELPLQRKIVTHLRMIDDRIDLLRQTNRTLEAIAQTIFKSWFVNFDPVHAKQQGIACAGIDAATAELFPNSFEDSELGQIPKGWRVLSADEILKRLSVGKKYEQKTSKQKGCVPILDQGKSGVIGYHDDLPSIIASQEEPVIVFANHTCYMRLISFPFSTIQNVLPFTGKGVDTIWLYYATMNKITFQEYKGHWPDFARQNVIVPSNKLTFAYSERVSPLIRKIFTNCIYIEILTKVRDTLLPRLISGKLDVSAIEAQLEEIA